MLYLPSALSKVTTRSLSATNDLLFVHSCLEHFPCVSLSFKLAPVGGRRFGPNLDV